MEHSTQLRVTATPDELVVDVLSAECRMMVQRATPDEMSLPGLQRAVNGYIEIGFSYASAYRKGVRIVLLIDEDGRLKPVRSRFFVRCLTTVNEYIGRARFVAEIAGPEGSRIFTGLTPDEAADIFQGVTVIESNGVHRVLVVDVC